MTITWFGLSSFKLVGKDLTVITDPFGSKTGLSPVRGAADLVIQTSPDSETSDNLSSISGNPFIINGPGEYDIKGAFVIGKAAQESGLGTNTIYSIELDEIRIALLGGFKQAQLTDEQKEALEGSDIVLVPVGGKQVLDYEQAAKIATQMEPYYIIPHSYKIPGLGLDYDKLDNFLKEMGGKHEEGDKLTLKKKDLSGESTAKVMVLTPQR